MKEDTPRPKLDNHFVAAVIWFGSIPMGIVLDLVNTPRQVIAIVIIAMWAVAFYFCECKVR